MKYEEYFCKKYNVTLKVFENGISSYECEKCENVCVGKKNVLQHFELHMEEIPILVNTNPNVYQCQMCGKKSKQRSLMLKHCATHVSPAEKRRRSKFQCHICDRKFFNYTTFLKHIKAHSDVRPFVCEECGKSYPHKCELQRHAVVHSTEKPYECELCKKTFKKRILLRRHYYSHTDEKRYSCHICFKEFKSKTAILHHLRCDLCDTKLGTFNDETLDDFIHLKKLHVCETCIINFKHRK